MGYGLIYIKPARDRSEKHFPYMQCNTKIRAVT